MIPRKMKTKTVVLMFFAVCAAVCVCCAAQAVDVVAVYYPHWHQYPKGDEWFGPSWKEGEWEFVKTAKVPE